MRKFAVYIRLLQLLVVCTWLVSLFVNYNHIFLCFCHYTVVFVLCVLNNINLLDSESVCLIPNLYTIIILHNVLLLTYSISHLLLLCIYGTKIKYHIISHIIHTDSVCHVSQDCIMVWIDWWYSRIGCWAGYVFGPKRRSYQGNRKKLHNRKLYYLFSAQLLWLGSTNEERDGQWI